MGYCNALLSFVVVLSLDLALIGMAHSSNDRQHHLQLHPHRRRSHSNARLHRSYEGIVFPSSISRSLHCYSCMSKRLENSWDHLWKMYRRPEHFSETCDREHFRRGVVKYRNCTDYCISIASETQVFGQRIPIYTRGCMSDVLNYRQDDARISKLRRKNGCIQLQLTELFNGGEIMIPNNEPVELCVCHASYCNGAPAGRSMASVRSTLPLIVLLLLILVASGFWRCTNVS